MERLTLVIPAKMSQSHSHVLEELKNLKLKL